jgi:hypothetical protein
MQAMQLLADVVGNFDGGEQARHRHLFKLATAKQR